MDEDGGRVSPYSRLACRAYWAVRVFCGYGLQPGEDGEPVVASGALGQLIPVALPAAQCAQDGLKRSPSPAGRFQNRPIAPQTRPRSP